MPNTMSSKKALRQSRRKRSHNLFWKNRVKIVVKDLKDSLQTKGATLDILKEKESLLQKYLDKAAKEKVIAKNKANRLKSKYGFIPIVSAKTMGQDKTLQTVDAESEKLSLELKDLGFNMNFAPVLDVDINPNNPIIGSIGRSFSSNPSEVVNQAEVFIQNHLDNNIITVGKHFPGHGSSMEDSHKGVVDITNTYREEELLPYKEINKDGLLRAVMVAHVMNKNIDENYPATLSKYFIQDILRDDIGFEGLVISDDM